MPKGWLWLLGAVLLQTAAQGDEILINLTNQVWKYNQSGDDLTGSGWEMPGYNDSSWLQGRGIFAYETSFSAGLSNNVYPFTNTVLTLGPIAFYFRTHFSVTGDAAHVVLTLSNLVDDGYVAYVNGVPADVFNMNASRTLAAGPVQGEGSYVVRTLCLPPGTLQQGDNVLAVAVCQSAFSSADVVWGSVLHAAPVVIPQVISPTNTVHIALLEGRSTNLSVWAGSVPCIEYQWFFNSNAIPGATGPTYTITDMDFSQAGTYYATVTTRSGSSRSPDFLVSFVTDPEPPQILSVVADPWDLSRVTVTFSEDVIDTFSPPPAPFDPYVFYIEDRDHPVVNGIGATNADYGASSNIVVVTLSEPRDPAIRYQLVIFNHGIEDRFGNRMYDPTVASVTVPTVFQNGLSGYLGTQDTEIHQNMPDAAFGQAAVISVDGGDPEPYAAQGLLRFEGIFGSDPGEIPWGASITKATLRMYTTEPGSSTPVRMLRMLAPWDEQTTWDLLGNGVDQTNGVETGATDALIVGTPDESFDQVDVTAAAQAWANGEPNYGWAFLPTSTDGWDFASSENATVANRPALIVEYNFAPPPCSIVDQPDSTMVLAGNPILLSVVSRGYSLEYQWYKDNAPITGATASSYSIARSRPSDSGNYFVVITNRYESLCISTTATVTVICDDYPLQLLSAIGNPDQTTVSLVFNDGLDPELAQSVGNYSISGLPIASASVSGNQVTLTTSGPRRAGQNYTLKVRNLQDDGYCFNTLYPNPTEVTLTQDVRLLSFNAVWKYQNSGSDLATAWRHPHYDDATWPQGLGLLGFETQPGTLAALSNQNLFVGTQLTRTSSSGQPIMTDYFRTLVNVPFQTAGVTFRIHHVIDDGAVFYFNGAEVARFNMPTGLIVHTTVAPTAPAEGVVRGITNLTGLACGLNSVAVEVHQQTEVSNDVLFGAELIARVPFFMVRECDGGLSIVLNGDGTITLYWTSPMAVLQETDELGGEWKDVLEAASPWPVTPTGISQFYRLRSF